MAEKKNKLNDKCPQEPIICECSFSFLFSFVYKMQKTSLPA